MLMTGNEEEIPFCESVGFDFSLKPALLAKP